MVNQEDSYVETWRNLRFLELSPFGLMKTGGDAACGDRYDPHP